MKWLAILGVAVLAGSGPAATPRLPLDAVLASSSGTPARISAYFGKPVLLFYEDPDSVRINQHWKEELARLSRQHALTDKINVVAVCDLRALSWQPALFFALLAVRSEEKKAGVPVLVDLTGVLSRAPWNLSAKRASVVVLSPSGELLFESTGPLNRGRFAQLLAALGTAVSPAVVEVAESPPAPPT